MFLQAFYEVLHAWKEDLFDCQKKTARKQRNLTNQIDNKEPLSHGKKKFFWVFWGYMWILYMLNIIIYF
jgi:hypothetical protein